MGRGFGTEVHKFRRWVGGDWSLENEFLPQWGKGGTKWDGEHSGRGLKIWQSWWREEIARAKGVKLLSGFVHWLWGG